jgi:hypothetical protein
MLHSTKLQGAKRLATSVGRSGPRRANPLYHRFAKNARHCPDTCGAAHLPGPAMRACNSHRSSHGMSHVYCAQLADGTDWAGCGKQHHGVSLRL